MRQTGPVLALGLSLVTYAAFNTFLAGGIGVAGRELGLTEAMTGMILSGGALVGMVAAPFWGQAVDLRGRRHVMLLVMPMVAAGAVVLALVFGGATLLLLPGLVLGRLLQTFFGAAVIPAAQAWTADATPARLRTRGMGALSATLSLGTIGGSLLLALTAGSGLGTGLLVLAAGNALAFGLSFQWLAGPPVAHPAKTGSERLDLRRLWRCLWVTLAGFTTYTMILPLHGLRLLDYGGVEPTEANAQAGWILLAGSATLFLSQVAVALTPVSDPRRLLQYGSLGTLPGLAALALSDDVAGMALSAACIGACLGLVSASNLALVSLAARQYDQGKAAGINASVRALGIALGPALGLGLYQPGGLMPFLFGGVLICAVVLVSFRV